MEGRQDCWTRTNFTSFSTQMEYFETLGSSSKLKEESDDMNSTMDEFYRETKTALLKKPDSSMVFMDMLGEDEDNIKKMREFQDYFEMLKGMVKPGCSQEVLNAALNSMSSLVSMLTYMSSPELHSSL